MEKALKEVEEGNSIRKTALKYGIPESSIRLRRSKKPSKTLRQLTQGRDPDLGAETEAKLADCIRILCQHGFSPMKTDVLELVQDYVRGNRLKTNFQDGKPSPEWMRRFLKRNNLSLKKATMLSQSRRTATANPFVIYHFYELLDKVVTSKNFGPHQIWNADETGFPHDPSKCRVIGPRGATSYRITSGPGKDNTTVLACASAAGEVFPPLFIFKGKNFQTTWKGQNALQGTMYACNESGWMETDIFYTWLQKFVSVVTLRPLLLLVDGHVSHVSGKLIKLAIENDVTLLKLPPHVTDVLQPLDVTCFGPLKSKWEKVMNKC